MGSQVRAGLTRGRSLPAQGPARAEGLGLPGLASPFPRVSAPALHTGTYGEFQAGEGSPGLSALEGATWGHGWASGRMGAGLSGVTAGEECPRFWPEDGGSILRGALRWGKVGLRKRLYFVLPATPKQLSSPGSRCLPRAPEAHSAPFSRSRRASGLPCAQVHTAYPQALPHGSQCPLGPSPHFCSAHSPRRSAPVARSCLPLHLLLPAPGPQLPEPPYPAPEQSLSGSLLWGVCQPLSAPLPLRAPQTRNQSACEHRWHRAWPGGGGRL